VNLKFVEMFEKKRIERKPFLQSSINNLSPCTNKRKKRKHEEREADKS